MPQQKGFEREMKIREEEGEIKCWSVEK